MGYRRPKHNIIPRIPQELWNQISSSETQDICTKNCQSFKSLPGKVKKGNYSSNEGRCEITGETVYNNASICNLGYGKESR